MYTYGWQRAETLGALTNGVFLVALCLSIFLEAIKRFVEPEKVSHPKLVLIVGFCGLVSNILGLFLFHEHSHGHGHDHGSEEHAHAFGEEGDLTSAEEGISSGVHKTTDDVADERGNVADVLPQNRIGNWPQTRHSPQENNKTHSQHGSTSQRRQLTFDETTPLVQSHRGVSHGRRRRSSGSRAYSTLEDINIYPPSWRNEIISAARFKDDSPDSSNENTDEEAVDDANDANESNTLLSKDKNNSTVSTKPHHHTNSGLSNVRWHKDHKHAQPAPTTQKSSHGHSHGNLNMRGVFLHVLGDALGNIGVMASAAFIWAGRSLWHLGDSIVLDLVDPGVSLVITVIILASAVPLCKAASRILLQAVPEHLSIDDITADIERLPGIVSCHHLHVWQLTDTTLIASLHVQVAFDFKGEGSRRYMSLARGVRRCLHEYGIHSSTIQPEFCLDPGHEHSVVGGGSDGEGDEYDGSVGDGVGGKAKVASKQGSAAASLCENANACLLECDDDCGDGKKCCLGRVEDEAQ